MYYIFYGFLYVFSLLPLRVLFLFSDLAYFILYYLIRYRRDIVMDNLTHAFPEKSEEEKTRISKKFYLNLTDNFIETIKCLSAGEKYISRHLTGDFSVLDRIYDSGKSCSILLGHNFNWEWANYSVSVQTKVPILVVYMPIKAQAINRIFMKIRQRGKAKLLSAHNMIREFMPYRKSLHALVLAGDQNPGDPRAAYWLNFFGRPTPFVMGPEKGVRPQDLPAVFAEFKKIKRGYYHLQFSILVEHPKALPEGELTLRFVRRLEEAITKDPDLWLWSHRRWKHKWDESYSKLWVDNQPPAV